MQLSNLGYDDIFNNHIKMEQIYINTSLFMKLDKKTVEERIQILETKFKESKINDYDNFLEYVSNLEENFIFKKEFDETAKSILIEFHKFCRQIQQEIKYIQQKEIVVQQLQQVDTNKRPILTYLLIKLLEEDQIKKQIPELQKDLINFDQSKRDDNKIQREIQQQYSQQMDTIKSKSSKSFKILILGAVGTGKTTLANKLFNFLSSKDKNQNIINRIDSETKFINVQSIKLKDVSIDILDSPSFGGAETNLKDVIVNICKEAKTINMIIYCFNATILRYNRQDLLTISIIQGLYQESWDNFYVTFNFMDLKQQNAEKEVKFEVVIESINKRIESNIPHQNILYNDNFISQKIQLLIEQQYKVHQYKKGFKKMTIPNMNLIEERCKQYSF